MTIKAVNVVRHTRNYKRMCRFYGDALELQAAQQWDEPGNRGTIFRLGGEGSTTLIEVLELGQEAVPGVKPVNVVLSVEVTAVDGWHDHLAGRGVTIARGLEDAPWGHRSFGIDDPDGLRLWFYEDIRPEHMRP